MINLFSDKSIFTMHYKYKMTYTSLLITIILGIAHAHIGTLAPSAYNIHDDVNYCDRVIVMGVDCMPINTYMVSSLDEFINKKPLKDQFSFKCVNTTSCDQHIIKTNNQFLIVDNPSTHNISYMYEYYNCAYIVTLKDGIVVIMSLVFVIIMLTMVACMGAYCNNKKYVHIPMTDTYTIQ